MNHEILAEEINAVVEPLLIAVGLAELHLKQRHLLGVSGVLFAEFRIVAAQLFLQFDQLFQAQPFLTPQHLGTETTEKRISALIIN